MLTHEDAQHLDPTVRRKEFIERMERKLAHKTAEQRRRRLEFRSRLTRMRSWQ
jgi:hypothetical protein